MTTRLAFLALLIATCAAASTTEAQHADTAAVGVRVRFRTVPKDDWQTGTVAETGYQSLVIRRCSRCADSLVTLRADDHFAVERRNGGFGSRRRNVLIGAGIGVVTGVALIIGGRCVDARNGAGAGGPPCELVKAYALPFVTGGGALLGALGGALIPPAKWEPVEFPNR